MVKNILSNTIIFGCFVVIYPLLFIFQCGDLTDTGFFANEYLFFADNISNHSLRSTIFLTSFLGNFWLNLAPNQELISLKILFLIFIYAIAYFSYKIGQNFNQPKWLLHLSIITGLIFATRVTNFVFEYDVTSYAALIAAVYFIIQGFKNIKPLPFFISGFLVGAATMFRFPSVLALAPFLLFILINNQANFSELRSIKLWNWKLAGVFILGFLALIAFTVAVIYFADIQQSFFSGFEAISQSVAGKDNSSHGVQKLLYKYLSDCVQFLPHLIIGIALMASTKWIFPKLKATVLYFIFLFIAIFFLYDVNSLHSYDSKIKFLPLVLFAFILITAKSAVKNTVILLTFSVLVIQIMGSNTGLFLKMSYGMIAFLPVITGYLYHSDNRWLSNSVIPRFSIIHLLLILSFAFINRWSWVYHVDDSLTARFTMTKKIEDAKFLGIYTNPVKSSEISQHLNILNTSYLNDKDLLITNDDVLYYFLTNKKPITSDFWLHNYQNHFAILNEIQNKRNFKTLVLLEERIENSDPKIDSLIRDLKSTHHYKVILSAQNFTIEEIYF